MKANRELIARAREHVRRRGGPQVDNGAWQMMLDLCDALERAEAKSEPGAQNE